MKPIRLLASVAVFAGAAPSLAHAFGLSPGLYNLVDKLGTFEQICLTGDLTWTGTGAYPISGQWTPQPTHTNIFGTASDPAVGNISIVVSADGRHANWTQWTSNLSFFNVVEPLKVTMVADTCS